MRVTLLLLFVQMAGTITPLFLFPEETFVSFPFVPTLEGQYIIKNVVLVAAAIVLGATVRGGELTPEPVEEVRPGRRTRPDDDDRLALAEERAGHRRARRVVERATIEIDEGRIVAVHEGEARAAPPDATDAGPGGAHGHAGAGSTPTST